MYTAKIYTRSKENPDYTYDEILTDIGAAGLESLDYGSKYDSNGKEYIQINNFSRKDFLKVCDSVKKNGALIKIDKPEKLKEYLNAIQTNIIDPGEDPITCLFCGSRTQTEAQFLHHDLERCPSCSNLYAFEVDNSHLFIREGAR